MAEKRSHESLIFLLARTRESRMVERERERADEEGGKTSGRRSIGKVGGVSCLLDFGPNSRLRRANLCCVAPEESAERRDHSSTFHSTIG